jgi:hypothetical protein
MVGMDNNHRCVAGDGWSSQSLAAEFTWSLYGLPGPRHVSAQLHWPKFNGTRVDKLRMEVAG